MSQQSQYHGSLHDLRADEACEFLLEDPNFVSWYRASESQKLVVLGEMGTGKTVSMAFLVDALIQRSECQLPQPKICYYYCRNDETGQVTRILSALILSLLEQLSGLKKTFFEWYKEAQASGSYEPATNVNKLEEFLQTTLTTLDRPLFFVIDGLDECDRASRSTLFRVLENLSKSAPRLKTLLSTRPQEEILEQLRGSATIELGSSPDRDAIIVRKTVESRLSFLSMDVRELVIERLSRMAKGSAIWTKMVVELVELRGIRALGPMSRFLEAETLPRDLSNVYIALISRCTSDDPENMELVTAALRVLSIARRSLSMLELAWAVALATSPPDVTTVAAVFGMVDHQRVMSLIHPFVARVDFEDVRRRQVRLVHQSVKEFVISQYSPSGPRLERRSTPRPSGQAVIDLHIESLEAYMMDLCVRYLLLDEIGDRDLFSEEQLAIEALPQNIDLFESDDEPVEYTQDCTWEAWEEGMIRYDPTERGFGELFVYASSQWLHHFGAVASEPLPELQGIELLCEAGSTRICNWINQYSRPDCTIQARFEFDGSLYDPLSITAIYGSEAMLRHMIKTSDFGNGKFLPLPAVGAAYQVMKWADLSRLEILFNGSGVADQLQNLEFFRLIMREWSGVGANRHDDWDPAFALADHALDVMAREQWGNELLCVAARNGCMPLVRRLASGARINPHVGAEILRNAQRESSLVAPRGPVHQSLGEAVSGNHLEVVEYLLHQDGIEAHLQYVNSRGENVLHVASTHCNPAMFRILIPRFRNGVHQKDNNGDTPLTRVIRGLTRVTPRSPGWENRHESARILLSQGEAPVCNEQQNPLRIAVRLGEIDMANILIREGGLSPLSALSRLDDGQLVLKDDTPGSEEDKAAMSRLLCTHINMASTLANQGAAGAPGFAAIATQYSGDVPRQMAYKEGNSSALAT